MNDVCLQKIIQLATIHTICVCGAGTMGSGIAQVAAMAGYTTLLYDVDAAMVQKAREGIEKSLTLLKEKNKLSSEDQSAIQARLLYRSGDELADCKADLIIEAIVEKPGVKEALFMRLAEINGREV